MRKFYVFFAFMLLAGMLNAKVVYVSSAGDNSTGLTWNNAFHNIQAALNTATNGDQIWVAQGTYVIESEATQLVFKSGVDVYGGFAGTETTLEARNSNPELTVISHKEAVAENFRLLFSTHLNDPAVWDGFTFDGKNVGAGVVLSGNCTLNNSIVKNCMVTNGSGAAVYMASDGVFIPVTLSNTDILNNTLKATADDAFQKGGAGVFVYKNSKMALIENCNIKNNTIEGLSASGNIEAMGAGIYTYNGTIKNCVIDNNHMVNSANEAYANNNFTAGAIAIVPDKVDVDPLEVLIENCVITNSTSNARGGAIIIDPRWSGQYHGNYTISKSIIAHNQTKQVGGGILVTASTAQTGDGITLNIENSIIANNSATSNAGGGIHLNIGCVLNITNSTIVKNVAGAYGGGGLFMQGSGSHTIKPTLKNVVLWGNEAPGRSTSEYQLRFNGQAGTMIFSAVQQYNPEYGEFANSLLGDNINLNTDNDASNGPAFVNPSTTAGYVAVASLSSDWRLQETSLLIDAGDDYLEDDFAGNKRPNGDYSDIGAYEYYPSTGVASTQNNHNLIYAYQDNLIIDNKINLRQVEVYSIIGTSIGTYTLSEGLNIIKLPANQLYIVKAGNIAKKVSLR